MFIRARNANPSPQMLCTHDEKHHAPLGLTASWPRGQCCRRSPKSKEPMRPS
jgi:hypothetical protein